MPRCMPSNNRNAPLQYWCQKYSTTTGRSKANGARAVGLPGRQLTPVKTPPEGDFRHHSFVLSGVLQMLPKNYCLVYVCVCLYGLFRVDRALSDTIWVPGAICGPKGTQGWDSDIHTDMRKERQKNIQYRQAERSKSDNTLHKCNRVQ